MKKLAMFQQFFFFYHKPKITHRIWNPMITMLHESCNISIICTFGAIMHLNEWYFYWNKYKLAIISEGLYVYMYGILQ